MKHLNKKTTLFILLALVMITALAFSLSACNLVSPTPISPSPSITEPDILPSNASLGNIATNAQTRITVNGGGNKGTVSFNSTAKGYYLVYVTADKLPAKNQQDTKKNNFTYSLINTSTNKNLVNKESLYAACYSPKDTSDEFAGRTRCWVFYLSANTKYNIVTKNNNSSSDKFTVKVEKYKVEKKTSSNTLAIAIEGNNSYAEKTFTLEKGKTYYISATDSGNEYVGNSARYGCHLIGFSSDKRHIVTQMHTEVDGSGYGFFPKATSYEGDTYITLIGAIFDDNLWITQKKNQADNSLNDYVSAITSDIRIVPLENSTITMVFERARDSKTWDNKTHTWTRTDGPDPSSIDTISTADYAIYLSSDDVKIFGNMYTNGRLIDKINASITLSYKTIDALKKRLLNDLLQSLSTVVKNKKNFETKRTIVAACVSEGFNIMLKSLITATNVFNLFKTIKSSVINAADAGTGLKIQFYHSQSSVGATTLQIKNNAKFIYGPYSHCGKWDA